MSTPTLVGRGVWPLLAGVSFAPLRHTQWAIGTRLGIVSENRTPKTIARLCHAPTTCEAA